MVNENDDKKDRDNDDKKIDSENDDNAGLSTGAIIGIVIAAICICIIACYGIREFLKPKEAQAPVTKLPAFENEQDWARNEDMRFFQRKGGYTPPSLQK